MAQSVWTAKPQHLTTLLPGPKPQSPSSFYTHSGIGSWSDTSGPMATESTKKEKTVDKAIIMTSVASLRASISSHRGHFTRERRFLQDLASGEYPDRIHMDNLVDSLQGRIGKIADLIDDLEALEPGSAKEHKPILDELMGYLGEAGRLAVRRNGSHGETNQDRIIHFKPASDLKPHMLSQESTPPVKPHRGSSCHNTPWKLPVSSFFYRLLPTPQNAFTIHLTCVFAGNSKSQLLAVADMGASRSVIPVCGLPPGVVTSPSRIRLMAANGTILNNLGSISFVAMAPNGPSVSIRAIVSSDLSGPSLISWHDLVALDILPEAFPSVMARTSALANVIRALDGDDDEDLSDSNHDVFL